MTSFFNLTDLGLEGSSAQVLQTWLSAMQAAYPGYSPSTANLEYVQAQVIASFAADLAQLCSSGGTELFRTYGTQLLGLPYQPGSTAVAIVTVMAVDAAGYTLPAGTQLTLTLDGAPLGFQTQADLVIALGSSTGNVSVAAVAPGTDFNGATDPGQLISQIDWVQGISTVAAASGGTEAEDDDHYLGRLTTTLQLLAPRPITAGDYAAIALDFVPAAGTDQELVGRATAIDGYDPGSNTLGNEREVTICVTDSSGNPLNSDTRSAVQAWFQSLREVNFIINVVSPNYSTIYVALQAKAAIGFAAASVQAAVQAALLAYLTPANWGLPPASQAGWTNYQTIFRSRVEAVVQNVPGVDHVVTGTLAMGFTAGPTNTSSDLTLAGPFPMPLSTVTSIPLSALHVS